ncbi:GIY-YIG nuclease family protein [Microbacterium halotolerans]|uniref:GIY-YIG nuclease family protein n=1 Tax=Microbacterium halotolerans TaxID=246613 RepID=UPI000E6AD587|nr:GIY-YIG nuclease family protein [Microbacterium halotolerans]
MTLTLDPILRSAGIDPTDIQAIRHAFVERHEDTGESGIHLDSTDDEVLAYTANQSASTRKFPADPPRFWLVFIREGGDRARLWSVVENRGETSSDGLRRTFDLEISDHLADLRNRLVIGWRSPRARRLNGPTAARYPVVEVADAKPIPFPGFDRIVLDHERLQAVMREHRYAGWRTALSSVAGIYLITDTSDGRQYVGKADGAESLRQRWSAYAANGHGGSVELRGLDPSSFRFSILRVFDPVTPTWEVDEAESHFKHILDTWKHGLNRNWSASEKRGMAMDVTTHRGSHER